MLVPGEYSSYPAKLFAIDSKPCGRPTPGLASAPQHHRALQSIATSPQPAKRSSWTGAPQPLLVGFQFQARSFNSLPFQFFSYISLSSEPEPIVAWLERRLRTSASPESSNFAPPTSFLTQLSGRERLTKTAKHLTVESQNQATDRHPT